VRGWFRWDFVSVPFRSSCFLRFFLRLALQHVAVWRSFFKLLTNYWDLKELSWKRRSIGYWVSKSGTLCCAHTGSTVEPPCGASQERKPVDICMQSLATSATWSALDGRGLVDCQIAGYMLYAISYRLSAIGYRLYSARPKDGYNWPKAATIYQRRLPFVLTTNIVDTGQWIRKGMGHYWYWYSL